MTTKTLVPGDLCVIAPRGRSVFAFEFFGSYLVGDVYQSLKTTGSALEVWRKDQTSKTRSFPFLTYNSIRLEEGAPVVVVHEPVVIDRSVGRAHMNVRRGSKICEVLTPDDGRTRWVKVGLLRKVK